MRHKHADLIHAWAEGAEIEYRNAMTGDKWFSGQWITWNASSEYRIKPEKKPDVVRYIVMMVQGGHVNILAVSPERQNVASHAMWQLKVSHDGDTGELIKAEVLK